jgi:hypothetical protein
MTTITTTALSMVLIGLAIGIYVLIIHNINPTTMRTITMVMRGIKILLFVKKSLNYTIPSNNNIIIIASKVPTAPLG